MGVQVTEGLGAGSQPQIGQQAAEECIDEIRDHLSGTHMAFVTAGMGGGTGTGAAPVVARAAREMGILTVGVVTKPFGFEGGRRMKTAELGIEELQSAVDTLIVIPNQNLFRIADEKTTLAEAFAMADQVLYEGVACITDLMVKEGLINLDFADVRSVMQEMGKAMMGTGEASGEKRAMNAAEAAIANPLLDETNMAGAQGLLISITGGRDMTLFELDEAATRIREEVDESANIIMGATFDDSLEGIIRVSVVATGIDTVPVARTATQGSSISDNSKREAAERMRTAAQAKVQTPAAEGSPVEEPAPQEARQPSQEGAAPSATAGPLRVTTPAARPPPPPSSLARRRRCVRSPPITRPRSSAANWSNRWAARLRPRCRRSRTSRATPRTRCAARLTRSGARSGSSTSSHAASAASTRPRMGGMGGSRPRPRVRRSRSSRPSRPGHRSRRRNRSPPCSPWPSRPPAARRRTCRAPTRPPATASTPMVVRLSIPSRPRRRSSLRAPGSRRTIWRSRPSCVARTADRARTLPIRTNWAHPLHHNCNTRIVRWA